MTVYANENGDDVWALVDKFPASEESEIILKQGGYNPTVVYNVLKRLSHEVVDRDGAEPIFLDKVADQREHVRGGVYLLWERDYVGLRVCVGLATF
jgi:hypothetical protein